METAVNFQLTEEEDYFSTLKKGINMLLFWGSACPHCEAVFATFLGIRTLITGNLGEFFALPRIAFQLWNCLF